MSRKVWRSIEDDYLREFYPHVPTRMLTSMFECSEAQIYSQAGRLGLKKSQAYLDSHYACRLRRGDDAGKSTRFKKGHTPFNKGMKYKAGGRSSETQFKKGQRAPNRKPVGAERVADSYLQRKLTDTGCTRKDWVAVHLLLWAEHNGPVPDGHAVVFKNGDKTDIRIDNMELISRGELMRRNTIHHLPRELADVCRLKGQVTRQINKRERNEKQD